MADGEKIPIVIVTGFLGSGKTTLLGKLLQGKEFAGTSVLINEYGQAGL
ncbi:MAG: GTP-binding protein, partial [Azoarcus sp.]|nr:GTP-binding protein [Azoarcus sp.]